MKKNAGDVLYENEGLRISSTTIRSGSTTHAMSAVTSVRTGSIRGTPSTRAAALLLICLGAMVNGYGMCYHAAGITDSPMHFAWALVAMGSAMLVFDRFVARRYWGVFVSVAGVEHEIVRFEQQPAADEVALIVSENIGE